MTSTATILTTLALLAATLTFAPSASAHVCAFDYGPDCAKDCVNDGKTHVHWGPRLIPCTSVPTLKELQVAADGHALLA